MTFGEKDARRETVFALLRERKSLIHSTDCTDERILYTKNENFERPIGLVDEKLKLRGRIGRRF